LLNFGISELIVTMKPFGKLDWILIAMSMVLTCEDKSISLQQSHRLSCYSVSLGGLVLTHCFLPYDRNQDMEVLRGSGLTFSNILTAVKGG